jgi:polyribonucleotide nucleotidyltransferase
LSGRLQDPERQSAHRAKDHPKQRSPSVSARQNASSAVESGTERSHEHQPPGTYLSYDNISDRDPAILLQPETKPISQEQLVNEVKGIYAGLVMVEKKCVEIDNQLAHNQIDGRQPKFSNEQWQELIALHRTLLHEHHDFFLASQHPSASPALRKLATKYAMPARMVGEFGYFSAEKEANAENAVETWYPFIFRTP